MPHGGSRPGAGRRSSGPDSVQVNWRVSEKAKAWIVTQAKVQDVSVAAIVDELIRSFEEVRDHKVLQSFSKLTMSFEALEKVMQANSDLYGILSQPMEIMDEMIAEMGDNPSMEGMIDRGNPQE